MGIFYIPGWEAGLEGTRKELKNSPGSLHMPIHTESFSQSHVLVSYPQRFLLLLSLHFLHLCEPPRIKYFSWVDFQDFLFFFLKIKPLPLELVGHLRHSYVSKHQPLLPLRHPETSFKVIWFSFLWKCSFVLYIRFQL